VFLQLSVVLGFAFGLLAAACAFVISYGEYKRNWSFRGSAAKMALRSALVAFAFFFLAAIGLVAVFQMVM
jgi:dipeptide/tripeptide permease